MHLLVSLLQILMLIRPLIYGKLIISYCNLLYMLTEDFVSTNTGSVSDPYIVWNVHKAFIKGV